MPLAPSSSAPVVRPADLKSQILCFALDHMAPVCAVLRAVAPILVIKNTAFVARYDDVLEVFRSDRAFAVPYLAKANVLLGNRPFFLSMDDTPDYREGVAAMREVVPADEPAVRLVPQVVARAEALLDAGRGRIDVVDYVRTVAFDVLGAYFGLPDTPTKDVPRWSTRLFEFQFADAGNDPVLDAEVAQIAPAMQSHVLAEIAKRRASGESRDDMLGRCLARRAAGDLRYSDDAILCGLIGFIAGGVPQLPMAAPQMVEQLLRRPTRLAAATKAAAENDDALRGYLFEALRFDAMAKVLPRVVIEDYTLAAGTPHARHLKRGTNVVLVMTSAMLDGTRIPNPQVFDATRPASAYLHFGCGHHECFGRFINRAFLPAVLRPLLLRGNLRRTDGRAGKLRKQGIFAERLVVLYG